MEMSEEEIVRSYKEAKKKRGQIQTLAELNACDKQKIISILKKHNITLPGNPNFRKSSDKQSDNANKTIVVITDKEDKKTKEKENTEIMDHTIRTNIKPEDKEETNGTAAAEAAVPETVKIKIPDSIRDQLNRDLESIKEQISKLVDRKIDIQKFLNEHS